METESLVETQKATYDAVDGQEKIRARDIKVLISQYGKLMGKDRLERVAGVLAEQLTTVVGVETCNDLRNVTFEIYVDKCRVVMIDAALLIRQFGIPLAPPIDGAAVEAIRSQKDRPLLPPSQGAKQGEAEGDGDMYDEQTQEEVNEARRCALS